MAVMTAPLFELRSVSKTYPGVAALQGVSLSIAPGEVLGLIGENGAGKSTLMKILGGIVAPTSGEVVVDGTIHTSWSVKEATRAGIAFVHQELNLFENLDVAANVLIGREPRRYGWLNLIDVDEARRRVTAILQRLGVDFAADTPVEDLSIAQCQMVEIAKALSLDARILILDEPTSSLTLPETQRLLQVIAELKKSNVAIIYITHRLAEIIECADRVMVLRDGRHAGQLDKTDISRDTMIRMMIGRDLKTMYLPPAAAPEADGLSLHDVVTDAYPQCAVSLEVRRGEIVGLAGLMGAGRTELAETVAGMRRARGGRILLDGKAVTAGSVGAAIASGIYRAPEDRKRTGLLLEMPIDGNVTIADLSRLATGWLVDRTGEREVARVQCSRLSVAAPGVDTMAFTLSGGNQQKIVLAKWLSMQPAVMIFDEPTRGIDVGAKGEIYGIMRALADAGVAVLMISSDMEEVIGVSDRILVMHEGRVSGGLAREAFSEHAVLTLATGGTGDEART